MPQIIILAGPNGAGKTTFARSFLPAEAACQRFINADLIAAGLSPFAPEQAALRAGRLMLEEIHASVARRDSFALETTLSGRGYLPMIRAWRQQGYVVRLFFLHLSSADLAVDRVALRVSQGGHHIPEAVIRRRYQVGWTNFRAYYRHCVDHWIVYDNSDPAPVMIDWGYGDDEQHSDTTE